MKYSQLRRGLSPDKAAAYVANVERTMEMDCGVDSAIKVT